MLQLPFFLSFPHRAAASVLGFTQYTLNPGMNVRFLTPGSANWFRVAPKAPVTPNVTAILSRSNHTNTSVEIRNIGRFAFIQDDPDIRSVTLANRGAAAATVTLLQLDRSQPCKHAVGLSTPLYLNLTTAFNFSDDHICYFFYEPDATYRVSFGCNASRESYCWLTPAKLLENAESQGISCEGDSVCQATFNDGFVAVSFKDVVQKNSTFILQLVKGPEQTTSECRAYAVSFYNLSGYFEDDHYREITKGLTETSCAEPAEPYFVAIIMLVILAAVLIAAILTFKFCTPNRETHQSDDEKRAGRRRLPSTEQQGSGEAAQRKASSLTLSE
jgi:hypothetical protein